MLQLTCFDLLQYHHQYPHILWTVPTIPGMLNYHPISTRHSSLQKSPSCGEQNFTLFRSKYYLKKIVTSLLRKIDFDCVKYVADYVVYVISLYRLEWKFKIFSRLTKVTRCDQFRNDFFIILHTLFCVYEIAQRVIVGRDRISIF